MQLFLFSLTFFLHFLSYSQDSFDLQKENLYLKQKIQKLEKQLFESERNRLKLHNELDEAYMNQANHYWRNLEADNLREWNCLLRKKNEEYRAFMRYQFQEEQIPQEISEIQRPSLAQILQKAQDASKRFEKLLKQEQVPASLVFDKAISMEHYVELMRTYQANLEALRSSFNNIMIGFDNRSECIRNLLQIFLGYSQRVDALFAGHKDYISEDFITQHKKFVQELQALYPATFISAEKLKKFKENYPELFGLTNYPHQR